MASSKIVRRNTAVASRTNASGSRVDSRKVKPSTSTSTTPGAIKSLPIKRLFRPDTPAIILERLDQDFGFWFVGKPDDDEFVDWFSTDLHKEIEARMTPGSWLRELRDEHGWTQQELGVRLGGISSSRISDWENNRRTISKEIAMQLTKLFRVSVERFL